MSPRQAMIPPMEGNPEQLARALFRSPLSTARRDVPFSAR